MDGTFSQLMVIKTKMNQIILFWHIQISRTAVQFAASTLVRLNYY